MVNWAPFALLLSLAFAASCTRYGDAILPAADAGRDANEDVASRPDAERDVPITPMPQPPAFDRESFFQEDLQDGTPRVKGLLALTSGDVCVLLERDSTVVSVTHAGGWNFAFGDQGIRRISGLAGRTMAHDASAQRLLVGGMSGDKATISALTYAGNADPSFLKGGFATFFTDITVLAPSSTQILVGGRQVVGLTDTNKYDLFLGVLGPDGSQKAAVPVDTGYNENALAFFNDGASLNVIGLVTGGLEPIDSVLIHAPLSEQGQVSGRGVQKMGSPASHALQPEADAMVASDKEHIFVMANAFRKKDGFKVSRRAIFAFGKDGAVVADFAVSGVAELPNAPAAIWTHIAITPAGLAVVGFEPSEGATIALLTVLDVGTGAPLPIFAPSGFVRLATPRAMPAVPMAVSAAGNGDLVIAGSTGIDGGSLFVGRVAASSVRPLR